MEVSLSDSDVRKYIPHIVTYEELGTIPPFELLNMLPLAILYQPNESEKDMGHWTLLHRTPEGLEFFDSYGFKPDEEFKMMSYKQPHYIAYALLNLSNYMNINYSPYDFQKKSNQVNTCGRWIIVRHMFKNYGIDKFKNAVDKTTEILGITPDELVVELTPEF